MSLNDPQWGRGGASGTGRDGESRGPQRPGGRDGPPDLDELWRDFNRRLNALFGRGGNGRSAGGGMRPDAKGAGFGVLAVLVAAVLIWLGSGFYIVQEGQTAVVTTFGKYSESTPPGFRWRLPWPIQSHEIVDVLSVRTVEIGARGRADRLKEALMLTDDENIVDVHFTVQYRIREDATGARDFVFNHRFSGNNASETVVQVAESAMREEIGRRLMDAVLFEARQQIADATRKRMQEMLDRYGTGIVVQEVAIQNAQPPEQVQAAFDDAVKAGQDRERLINEGQAYANDVVPKARGTAARLIQEAEGYRTRVIETAQGDAARFKQLLVEYNRAPAVTRERLYLETMQQILANTTKVLIDTRANSNLLYLPLDKLLQQAQAESVPATPRVAPAPTQNDAAPTDVRGRDTTRSRERDSR
ncbi:MAG: FtsH protease activity modulator HflK [Sutterellaceae bacterium]|nr:FtsH protease activity modulator HflK [Burkholderiaceae bacterium]MCX7900780.1 FtsH protease activity modulator HflK [Burkholderiaceae bacterium]MDW8429068.1 FtsH protease activity modulator HflK [Sutterellaceae bacterium]